MSDETPVPSQTEMVEVLAAPTPKAVEDWRNEHMPERRIYKNSGFESVVPDNAFNGADMPPEKRAAAVQNLRGMFADTGLAPHEANCLMTRASAVQSENKTAEEQRAELRYAFDRRYGKDADAALADAMKMVKRDPRFSTFIEKKRLGLDSQTLLTLATAARSQRNTGKLK